MSAFIHLKLLYLNTGSVTVWRVHADTYYSNCRDTVLAQNEYSDETVYNSEGIINLLSKCL